MTFHALCDVSVLIAICIGLKKDILKFVIYVLTLLLTSCAASALTFSVSAGVGVFAVANICAVLQFVFQMVIP